MRLELNSKHNELVDYVFWFVFVIFSNPGGILAALGENSNNGGINVTDLLYALLALCFIHVFRWNKINNDISFKKISKYLIIFLIYYLIVFSFLIPELKNNPFYSPANAIIKIRHSFMHISLTIFVYEFYLRSFPIFFKIFLYVSVVVIILFIISIFTGADILPVISGERRFVETKRLFMSNYGLLPVLIPMGLVVLIFKFDIKYKKLFIIGFALMFLVWLFSIYRRHIFGTVIYLIIALFLYSYLNKKALISMKKLFSIASYVVILLFVIQLTFPEYIQSGIDAANETVHVIKTGKTSLGKEDHRLGGGKDFLQGLIKENYFFGTGFDNRWRSSEGDKAGYEASDYPFLGSIAMYGIVGLLFFLPVYIVLIKALLFDIKYLRNFKYNDQSFITFMMIFFIVYFIYDLMQYMNWFLPLSVIMNIKWYVFLGMYLASRKIFYESENALLDINEIDDQHRDLIK